MWKTLQIYSRLVALPHSVFALPFALVSFLVASRKGTLVEMRYGGLTTLLLVVCCVVIARAGAMTFNRICDEKYDRQNLRTAQREIPQGLVSRGNAWKIVLACSTVFLFCAFLLGSHCLVLAPGVLVLLFGYSVAKRFTWTVHFILGLCLAAAAGGAWWVLRPMIEVEPITLMFGVMFWVAGFDVLYSCQDVAFDREQGLYSLPAKFGVPVALRVAFYLHVLSMLAFFLFGVLLHFSTWYFIGTGILALLFLGQHRLVKADDLSLINHAFFTCNGIISLGYFVTVACSI